MAFCGGYFLTADVERPKYVSADLLPPRVISLSDCICDFVPDSWAVAWAAMPAKDRAIEAKKHGIGAADLPSVTSWTTERMNSGQMGWPCVFHAASDARAFASRFLSTASTVRLLGVGLHADYVDRFLLDVVPGPTEGAPGVYQAISRRVQLESGSTELGWEVLCYEYGNFHSWLCNGLETKIAEVFGVKPNDVGLIQSAEDATTAAMYCGREDVGAEPGFWAPWLLVEYSLVETES